jgi:hypothetical protein
MNKKNSIPNYLKTNCGTKDFDFSFLQLSKGFAELKNIEKRVNCINCNKSILYFCYNCFLPLTDLPYVRLPLNIKIIKHKQEKNSKSTAVHARLLCPDDVNMINYEDWSSGVDLCHDLLLFPGPDAQRVSDFTAKDKNSIKNVFVIDGPWEKVKALVDRDVNLRSLKKISLSDCVSTNFWRRNNLSDDMCSTIEALYYFLTEWDTSTNYDDILYLFAFFHHLISKDMRSRKILYEKASKKYEEF